MPSLPPCSCSVVHDGIVLKGTVAFLCPSDVSVAITSPFSGIVGGSHTPAFAMFAKNRNIDDAGAITPKGFAAIERGLIAAYRQASALYENREALYARILDAHESIEAAKLELERFEAQFRADKRTKKRLFKHGMLPESEYAAFLKTGRARMAMLQDHVLCIKRGVFDGCAGIRVAYGQEEQAAAFVAKYFSLM
jgi:hypothetical protein